MRRNPPSLPMLNKDTCFPGCPCSCVHDSHFPPYRNSSAISWLWGLQLVPALLSLNLGVLLGLAVVTLVLGRVYCSILCPLGLFQDVVARLARRRGKRSHSFAKARTGMRHCVLALFLPALLLGLGFLVALLDPYASFGRMMNAWYSLPTTASRSLRITCTAMPLPQWMPG